MYNSVIFDICLKFFIIKSWGMGKPIIMRQGEQKTNLFNIIALLCNRKLKVSKKIQSKKTPFTMAKKLKIKMEMRDREPPSCVNPEFITCSQKY